MLDKEWSVWRREGRTGPLLMTRVDRILVSWTGRVPAPPEAVSGGWSNESTNGGRFRFWVIPEELADVCVMFATHRPLRSAWEAFSHKQLGQGVRLSDSEGVLE